MTAVATRTPAGKDDQVTASVLVTFGAPPELRAVEDELVLDAILATADIVVITLPLNRDTHGLIGARELSLMKPDAILINVARAAIVDEDALYDHLVRNPGFSAGLDVWWQEPGRSGAFTTRRPFLNLSNVIGSPHNSAATPGSLVTAAREAAGNLARAIRGETVQHLINRADYVA
jgi:phosphoglycerate dehydrogenase-like enzyme